MTKLKVAVVMGAESDLPVVKKAIDQLDAHAKYYVRFYAGRIAACP